MRQGRRYAYTPQSSHLLRVCKKIAIGICLIVLGACIGVVGIGIYMAARATPTEPESVRNDNAIAFASTTFERSGLFPHVDWDYWQSVNHAVVAWISIPDTPINYAVVQADASDPDYYLTHDIYGNYNIYGCPYIDASCGAPFNTPNTVIYGHHMKDGTMFAAFSLYSDKAFADNHCLVYVQTPSEQRIYEIQAADIIDGSEALKRTSFLDDEDFLRYYRTCINQSDMQRATQPIAQSCITFCTCSYHFNPENERTLVFAQPRQITPTAQLPAR